jgi:SAM-dependent methyltransferase
MRAPPSLAEQLARGAVVCPTTRAPLRREGDMLVGGARPYPIDGDAPCFLEHAARAADVHKSEGLRGRFERVSAALGLNDDGRSRAALAARARVVDSVGAGDIAVSIGGGPAPSAYPGFLNLNIFAGPHVDVVADAAALPWADGSVAAIECEAVLEHLRRPAAAVAEMLRVLRPGGLVFSATPFMQGFHGVPDHFQNYTLAGHRALFEDVGFVVEEAGVCVGPLVALATQAATFAGDATGSAWLRRAGLLGGRLVARADRAIAGRPWAANLASSTFVVARRP